MSIVKPLKNEIQLATVFIWRQFYSLSN